MNPLKSLLFLCLLSLTAVAHAAPQDLYGKWGYIVVKPGNGLVLNASFEFTETEVIAHNKCTLGAKSLEVAARAPVQITDSDIEVLGSDEAHDSIQGLDCSASIHPDTMQYVVSGAQKETLVLSGQGQKPITLKRIKPPAQDLYGKWGYIVVKPGNGTTITGSFEFTDKEVIAHSKCTLGAKSLEVSAHVPAKITDTEVETLGSDEAQDSIQGLECHVSIQPDTMQYVVKGAQKETLVLSGQGHKPLTLKRIK